MEMEGEADGLRRYGILKRRKPGQFCRSYRARKVVIRLPWIKWTYVAGDLEIGLGEIHGTVPAFRNQALPN